MFELNYLSQCFSKDHYVVLWIPKKFQDGHRWKSNTWESCYKTGLSTSQASGSHTKQTDQKEVTHGHKKIEKYWGYILKMKFLDLVLIFWLLIKWYSILFKSISGSNTEKIKILSYNPRISQLYLGNFCFFIEGNGRHYLLRKCLSNHMSMRLSYI